MMGVWRNQKLIFADVWLPLDEATNGRTNKVLIPSLNGTNGIKWGWTGRRFSGRRRVSGTHRCEIKTAGTYLEREKKEKQGGKMFDHHRAVDLVSDRTWLWTVQLLQRPAPRAFDLFISQRRQKQSPHLDYVLGLSKSHFTAVHPTDYEKLYNNISNLGSCFLEKVPPTI